VTVTVTVPGEDDQLYWLITSYCRMGESTIPHTQACTHTQTKTAFTDTNIAHTHTSIHIRKHHSHTQMKQACRKLGWSKWPYASMNQKKRDECNTNSKQPRQPRVKPQPVVFTSTPPDLCLTPNAIRPFAACEFDCMWSVWCLIKIKLNY